MICSNLWCKALFVFTDDDIVNDVQPNVCDKCKSFDKELSGGVSWVEKKYEGDRFDVNPHQMNDKISNFTQ